MTENQDRYVEEAIKIISNKKALCFEGGGVLGVGHVGALSRLYELGGLNEITHVVGTSVGSFLAAALACGASVQYAENELFGLNLKGFKDGSKFILFNLFRFLSKWGLYEGEKIEEFGGKIMNDLTGNAEITFQEAYDKFGIRLTIVYLSCNLKKTMYADHILTPNQQIKRAIRKSSAIPAYFAAVPEKEKGKVTQFFVDGGVTDNYPIHVLKDQGCPIDDIMGFKLCNDREFNEYKEDKGEEVDDIDYGRPKNALDHVMRLIDIVHAQAIRYHVHKEDWKITTKINIGELSTTDFDITEEQKLWIYEEGRKAMDVHVQEVANLLSKSKYPRSNLEEDKEDREDEVENK